MFVEEVVNVLVGREILVFSTILFGGTLGDQNRSSCGSMNSSQIGERWRACRSLADSLRESVGV